MAVGVLVSGALVISRLTSHGGTFVPLRLVCRVLYVPAMLALASVLFELGSERILSEIGLHLVFAAAALGMLWPLLEPAERSFIAHGPRLCWAVFAPRRRISESKC